MPVLDVKVLQKMRADFGDDTAVVLLGSFLSDSPNQIAELDAALKTQDLVAAGRAAHTLKSTALLVGAGTLADQCAAVEDACKDGQAGPAVSKLAATLKKTYSSVETAVGRELAKLQ